jgi:hypothetical protein
MRSAPAMGADEVNKAAKQTNVSGERYIPKAQK